MTISGVLLAQERELWAVMARHPFLLAAADGTLPPEDFDRWLVEDHHFVVGFRRFLARLVELAPTEEARDLLAGGLAALQGELDLFRAEADQRGLDLHGEPTLTTLGYTSYLLASPADGWDTALTVLYGAEKAYFDAWSVVHRQAEATSPYWPFIDNWSSPAFGAWVDDVGRLVEQAGRDERSFERVVRFELRFWDAVHGAEGW